MSMVIICKYKYIVTIVFIIILSILIYYNFFTNMDGVSHLHVYGENKELKGVLVIPLYAKTYGIGFGVDGKGIHTPIKYIIRKPYVFDSGGDLLKNKIKTKGFMLSSKSFIGRTMSIKVMILLKKGYLPKFLFDNNIYSGAPIYMKKSNNDANVKMINILLKTKPDQIILKRILLIECLKDDESLHLSEEQKEFVISEIMKSVPSNIEIDLTKDDLDLISTYE
ncbi:MAG: hypothetical protein VB050_14320 [Geobacteraceae bacterium]|nr:hypothetical protein [Geobacteraceae bacterium]